MQLSLSDTKFLSILSNKYFRYLKQNLVDGHIYDIGRFAIPRTSKPLEFQLTGCANKTVQVFCNGAVVAVLPNTAEDPKTFAISLRPGSNTIFCQDLNQATDRTNRLHFAMYDLDTFLWAYAQEFLDRRHDALQTKQNIYIPDDLVSEDDISYATTTEALRDHWGNLFSIYKPDDWTKQQFRALLQAFVVAYYNYPLTKKGFSLVISAITGSDCILFEYPHEDTSPIGRRLKVYVPGIPPYQLGNPGFEEVGTPPPSWTEGDNISAFTCSDAIPGTPEGTYVGLVAAVEAGSFDVYQEVLDSNLPSGLLFYVSIYLRSASGPSWTMRPRLTIRNVLGELLHFSDSITADDVWEKKEIYFDPQGQDLRFGIEASSSNPAAAFFIDDVHITWPYSPYSFSWDGTLVNLKERWFVLPSGSEELLNQASGAETFVYVDYAHTSSPNEERLVVQQADSFPLSTVDNPVKLLGVIIPGASQIEAIKGCFRIDDGCIVLDDAENAFGFEVFVPDSANLTTTEKDQIVNCLHRLKPGHKLGYLLTEISGGEDESPLRYHHYLKGYEFWSKI